MDDIRASYVYRIYSRGTDMNHITQHMTDFLTDKYGPVLSINQLAEVLDRSPDGLRVTLQRDCEASNQLNSAKSKVGRRVYFNAVRIAEIMTDKTAPGN